MKTSVSTLVAERFDIAAEFEARAAGLDDDALDVAVDNVDCVLGVIDRLISELPPATLSDLRAQLALYRAVVEYEGDGPAEPIYRAMLAGLERLEN